jgi:hypothetical protein
MRRQPGPCRSRPGHQAGRRGGISSEQNAGLGTLERGSHRPRRFAGGDDEEWPVGKLMQESARQCGKDEMAWFDALEACAKNAVQVGANAGEEIGQ